MTRQETKDASDGFAWATGDQIQDDQCKGVHWIQQDTHANLQLVGMVSSPNIEIFIVAFARHQR